MSYLSRVVIDPRCHAARRDLRDIQQLHRTLMAPFAQVHSGPARSGLGVLFRIERVNAGGVEVLVQSGDPPAWDVLPQAYTSRPPETRSLEGLFTAIHPGEVIRFRLAAAPLRNVPGARGADARCARGAKRPIRSRTEASAWALRRFERAGLEDIDLAIVGEHAVRGQRAGSGELALSGFTFEGTARVRDPEALRTALTEGIGPGKAYGYGLMTIVPLAPARPGARAASARA